MLNNKKIQLDLINKGKSVRDFIHIDNVVNCYKQIIRNKNTGILDIGSGFGVKIIDIVEALGKKILKFIILKKMSQIFQLHKILVLI